MRQIFILLFTFFLCDASVVFSQENPKKNLETAIQKLSGLKNISFKTDRLAHNPFSKEDKSFQVNTQITFDKSGLFNAYYVSSSDSTLSTLFDNKEYYINFKDKRYTIKPKKNRERKSIFGI